MTIVLAAAAATFGAAFVACMVLLAIMGKQKRADDAELERLDEQRDGDSKLIAELRRDVERAETGGMIADDKLARVTAELEEQKRLAGLAAKAGMNILARERDEWLQSLQAWQFNCAALALAARVPAAIEAVPAALTTPLPPVALPSGEHFLVADGDGSVLLQVDDLELPAGARGTGA